MRRTRYIYAMLATVNARGSSRRKSSVCPRLACAAGTVVQTSSGPVLRNRCKPASTDGSASRTRGSPRPGSLRWAPPQPHAPLGAPTLARHPAYGSSLHTGEAGGKRGLPFTSTSGHRRAQSACRSLAHIHGGGFPGRLGAKADYTLLANNGERSDRFLETIA